MVLLVQFFPSVLQKSVYKTATGELYVFLNLGRYLRQPYDRRIKIFKSRNKTRL